MKSVRDLGRGRADEVGEHDLKATHLFNDSPLRAAHHSRSITLDDRAAGFVRPSRSKGR